MTSGQTDYPLTLNTGRVRDQWHTMTRTGRVPHLMTHIAGPRLALHPRDAARRGIEDGGLARIDSPHGSAVMRASDRRRDARRRRIRADALDRPVRLLRPRSAGWCMPLTDPVSGQPDLKGTSVQVAAVAEAWRGLLLRRAAGDPALGESVHWSKAPVAAGFAYELSGWTPLAELIYSESALRSLLQAPEGAELVSYSDPKKSVFRYAAWSMADWRLVCSSRAPRAAFPEADQAALLLGEVLDPIARLSLLAGVEPGAAPSGDIVCSCFSVGEAAIRGAIRTGNLASAAEIGAALTLEPIAAPAFPNSRSCWRPTPPGYPRRRDMTGPLDGLTILVPESRELDLFVRLLEAEGAAAVRCPLVQILDLEDTAEAEAWIERLIADAFQDVIWLTGEGLRRLLPIAERKGRRAAFVAALGRARMITRGPKPARALRELDVRVGLPAAAPTSQGVLDALAGEDLGGRSIGVQLYPGEGGALVAALRERGATASPVTPYRYASQAEVEQVVDAIHGLAEGRIGMIAFTSSPQVERLVAVARDAALEAELREAFTRVRIAAIGPVVEETLRRHGVANILRPDGNFHLKPLVRAIATDWSASPK